MTKAAENKSHADKKQFSPEKIRRAGRFARSEIGASEAEAEICPSAGA